MRFKCYYTEDSGEIKLITDIIKSLDCPASDLDPQIEQLVFLAIDMQTKTCLFCFDTAKSSVNAYIAEIAQATFISFQDIKTIAFDLVIGGIYK